MRCVVLLITHPGIAQSLLQTVRHMLGEPLPLAVKAVELDWNTAPADALVSVMETIDPMVAGSGLLVLTDLYGGSPSNLAALVVEQMPHAHRVAGVNLPMLLRVLNYPDLALEELAKTAANAARTGVIVNNA